MSSAFVVIGTLTAIADEQGRGQWVLVVLCDECAKFLCQASPR